MTMADMTTVVAIAAMGFGFGAFVGLIVTVIAADERFTILEQRVYSISCKVEKR